MLKVCGSGAFCVIFDVKSLANLYAGALRQLTIGRMEWSVLWSFTSPFTVGADGLIMNYMIVHARKKCTILLKETSSI